MADGAAFTDEPGENQICYEDFDFSRVDSLEDVIRENLSRNRPIAPIIERLIDEAGNERVCEALAAVIAYIADSQKPRLAADYVAWISGMRTREGISLPALAAKHGTSKQAFSQGALKLARILRIQPSRAMRRELAKTLMRTRHFKRRRHGPDQAA